MAGRRMTGGGGSAAMAPMAPPAAPAPAPAQIPEPDPEHILSPPLLREVLEAMIDMGFPSMIWGPPGVGKSQIVRTIVEERANAHLVELRLALLADPSELRGLPVVLDAAKLKMDWAPTPELPTAESTAGYDRVVLFLDEINGADPQVQAAAYQLILDRRVGTYTLPDNVSIVAAGNRENDRGVTHRMPKPLSNRMFHFHLGADYPSWRDWGIRIGIHPHVQSYLAFSKSDLLVFDPSLPDKSFATPRMWERVSDILHRADEGMLTDKGVDAAVIAAIGQTTGTAFNAHRRYHGMLPEPDRILSGEISAIEADGSADISARYAITVSLATEISRRLERGGKRKAEADFRDAFENAIRFIMKNFVDNEMDGAGAEMAYLFIKIATSANREESQAFFTKIFARIAKDGKPDSPTVRFLDRYSHLLEGQ